MNIKSVIKNIMPYGIMKDREKNKESGIIQSIPESEMPVIFNKNGERMNLYYLQDKYFAHCPYTLTYGVTPTQVYWDRYNYQLNYHMYTGQDALNTKGTPIKKFALLCEAEVVSPMDYDIFRKNKSLPGEFESVFTFSSDLLNRLDNAQFIPASTVWIGTERGGGQWCDDIYMKKNKMVSMIASNKTFTYNQKLRVSTAKRLKQMGLADTFGKFDGGEYFAHVSDALVDYRFHVVVENESEEYTFTEKILNCFATMTIPIYYGATKIDEFFNSDGIIKVTENDLSDIEKVINKCTVELYNERIHAIKDNYERAKEYRSLEDYMFQKYRSKLNTV